MNKVIYFLLLLIPFDILAQSDSSFRLLRIIPGDYSAFTADNLGNLFLLTRNNQLKKLNEKGDSVAVYNDVRRFGKLTYIDATNPLKTLLFYKDFRTVVVVDRFLNMVNTIDLRQQKIFQVKAIAQSYDNNVWVYDEQEFKLKKIGEDGRLLSETSDFRQVFDQAPVPTRIFDQEGFVYLYDPQLGMFVFDYYGTLKNRLPLLQWDNVQVIGKTIAGRSDGKYTAYVQGSPDLKEAILPKELKEAQFIQISPQGVYMLAPDGVHLYDIR